jgi:hypothetical protein
VLLIIAVEAVPCDLRAVLLGRRVGDRLVPRSSALSGSLIILLVACVGIREICTASRRDDGRTRSENVAIPNQRIDEVLERLDRIETTLTALVERQTVRGWYSTEEAAKVLGKSEYTVRE